MRKILFYGDSNTYGYDPADFYENRYPAEKRWISILQGILENEWEICADGMNGRKIPELKYDGERLNKLIRALPDPDIFAVMLGTNDILSTMCPNADEPVRKMQKLLEFLMQKKKSSCILLIAPVPVGDVKIRNPLFHRYYEESLRMNAGFCNLADACDLLYADAGNWEVELGADHVHFSENGHRRFAGMMGEYLQGLE